MFLVKLAEGIGVAALGSVNRVSFVEFRVMWLSWLGQVAGPGRTQWDAA